MAVQIRPMILAGGEFDTPADTPSGRLDAAGEFSFVGALEVSDGVSTYTGSGVALSRHWVLTAGHNVDFDDNGLVDASWSGNFHLPGLGVFSVSDAFSHPDFSGFGNPVVNDDLALLRLASPLPDSIAFPGLGVLGVGDEITLVGFGRSGFGSYGYTSNAGLTDRRHGMNVVDALEPDDEGSGLMEVFRYDFDDPSSLGAAEGSLGNDVETIIAPGDSGGPALRQVGGSWQVVGINTYTEGFGGKFGDTGGGVVVEPYRAWIESTLQVPEPDCALLLSLGLAVLLKVRRRY